MPQPRLAPSHRRSGLRPPHACVAVDWSGAIANVRSRLWLAESRGGGLVRLEHGFSRDEVVHGLIELAQRDASLVVGLDFAFSFPSWFVAELGVTRARELWELVAREGEEWLAACPAPFWGRPAKPRPAAVATQSAWRATESVLPPVSGIGPKSIFQVGGAGSVGTGSLRGMPYLAELQDAGFSIWPFDPPRLPMVVELYPRYLTGPVDKSSRIARALYLEARHAREPRALLDLAASSEDAFDAAVSAACMQRFARDFARLTREAPTPAELLEGRIWVPLRDPVLERV